MAKGKRGNPNMRVGAPSINPSGKPKAKQEHRDGWINSASGHGTSRDRRMLTNYGIDVVTDLEAKQLWRSEWLCKRIIEVLPGEANRRGWDLRMDDAERAAAVTSRAQELDLDGHMTRAGEFERAYGGAAIFPVMTGALGDLSTPLDETKIAEIVNLLVLEPQELLPFSYYTNLDDPKFGHPSAYWVRPLVNGRAGSITTTLVHESRLIIFPGKRVSRQTQPGQREGWGDSELNHAREIIADAGLTWGSVATLLHEFGQGVYAIDGLADMMAQKDGPDQLNRRMDAMDLFKSTMRATAIDAKDSYTRQSTPVSGLDGLLAQQKEWLAAVAETPLPILFGQQLGGMQSTGDAEIRNWYAKVEKVDSTHYKPRREHVIRFLLLEGGQPEPDTWSVESRPLWTPNDKERAETLYLDMQRAALAIDKGVVSADDVANSFYGSEEYNGDITVDWAARDAQQKAEEQMQKAQLEALQNQPPPTPPPQPGSQNGSAPPADQQQQQPRADMIEHRGSKWVVLSRDGSKVLGEYDTEDEAKKRLAQIEYFKHES